ncbi:ROK family transcriptional regulator [Frankia sp. Cr1]|uniref:ROK family transcriptional regulator n=1 Tax=Frankia sp. Cr1 TaxID=3073931 RepID=UPI002AD4360E|nr:ROK family transcriptional regulator [Frankia sp. Cr1]
MRRHALAPAGEVFRLIRGGEAATRADIASLTGMSRTAVALRVSQLLEQGLVVERTDGPSTGGRPPSRLEFHTSGGVVLAASMGASRAQLAVCDLTGKILAEDDLEADIREGPDAVLPEAAGRLEQLLAGSAHARDTVRGVGVSVPGSVDVETGRTVSPLVLPGWDGVAIPPYFTNHFAVPVLVDNDVNVMTLGEYRTQYDTQHVPPVGDLLFVKASTGIGAGIMSGGRLQRGALGAAGEIGHIRVCDGGGAVCRCGNVDCLEAVAGGWALVRRLSESGRAVDGVRGVIDLVRAGDHEALRLVREAGRRIGEVLAAAVNLLNPAFVVIGGDLAHVYDPLVAGLREVLYQRSTTLATRYLQILPSVLEERAGIIGCAVMVLEEVLSPRSIDTALAAAPPRSIARQ